MVLKQDREFQEATSHRCISVFCALGQSGGESESVGWRCRALFESFTVVCR